MKMQTIELDHGNLKVQTKAYVFGEWAAHRNPDGEGWRVSHVPSGHAVRQLARKGDAVVAAVALSERIPQLRLTPVAERKAHEPRFALSESDAQLILATIKEEIAQ